MKPAPTLPQQHAAKVLGWASLLAPLVIYCVVILPLFPNARWQGQAILILAPTAILVLLWRATVLSARERETLLRDQLESDHIHWPLEGTVRDVFRKHQTRRYLAWFWVWVAMPLAIAIALATFVVAYNLSSGVSFAHCLKMGGAILLTATLLVFVAGLTRWVFTYPSFAFLNHDPIEVVCLPSFIIAGDLFIDVEHWKRSREVALVERDGSRCIQLRLTRTGNQQGGIVVHRLVQDIPIPTTAAPDIESLRSMYNLNADQGLHESRFGWFGKRSTS